MSEWKVENIATLANGKKAKDISQAALYPIYGGNGIMGYTNSSNASNVVIIGRVGAYCGSVHYSRGKCWISDNAISARAKNDNSIDYLYYLLSSLNLNRHHIGGAQPLMTQGIINNIDIPRHSLSEQKKIAAILSSLDEKIETNRKINARLEELAQALFKSWFIDFEPFGGKMPEDWKRINIGALNIEISDFVANGSFASLKENVTLYDKPEFAYFIRNTDLKVNSFSVFVDEHSYKFLSKSRLFGGEIIISNVGDVGSVFLCPTLDKPMTLGNNIIMVRPQKDCLTSFLYLFFRSYLGQHLIDGITGGSAQPKFNKTDFKRSVVILPKDDTLMKFENIMRPILTGIEHRSKESAHLAALRDALLPKLMSGEMKLS